MNTISKQNNPNSSLNLPKYRLKYLSSLCSYFYKLLKSEAPEISELEFLNAYYHIEPGAISINMSNGKVVKLAVGTSGARIMETNVPSLMCREVRFYPSKVTERISNLIDSATYDIVKASDDEVLMFDFSVPRGYLRVKSYRGKIFILESEGGR
jgi:hypothetical protein